MNIGETFSSELRFLGGETNTNTGNKLTTLPIVGWNGVGNTSVDLTLYHSSLGTYSGAFGEGWSHTYEESVAHTVGSSAIVREADGLTVPFTENADGTFTLTSKDLYAGHLRAAGHGDDLWAFGAQEH